MTRPRRPVRRNSPWLIIAFVLLLFAFFITLGGGVWMYMRAVNAEHAALLEAEMSRAIAEEADQQARAARRAAEEQNQSP